MTKQDTDDNISLRDDFNGVSFDSMESSVRSVARVGGRCVRHWDLRLAAGSDLLSSYGQDIQQLQTQNKICSLIGVNMVMRVLKAVVSRLE